MKDFTLNCQTNVSSITLPKKDSSSQKSLDFMLTSHPCRFETTTNIMTKHQENDFSSMNIQQPEQCSVLSPIVTEDDNLKKNSVCSITYVSDIADEINNGKLMISMSNILAPSNGPSIAPVAIFHAK
jgi:hypothetical protein